MFRPHHHHYHHSIIIVITHHHLNHRCSSTTTRFGKKILAISNRQRILCVAIWVVLPFERVTLHEQMSYCERSTVCGTLCAPKVFVLGLPLGYHRSYFIFLGISEVWKWWLCKCRIWKYYMAQNWQQLREIHNPVSCASAVCKFLRVLWEKRRKKRPLLTYYWDWKPADHLRFYLG